MRKHGVTANQADEALADPNRVVIEPDHNSRSDERRVHHRRIAGLRRRLDCHHRRTGDVYTIRDLFNHDLNFVADVVGKMWADRAHNVPTSTKVASLKSV